MDLKNITEWLSNQRPAQTPLVKAFSQYLTVQEAAQILEQFRSDKWTRNGQVLWSGVPRDKAQKWADDHHLQTLTTAMGPLMDTKHPKCLRPKKSSHKWSQYIHGASAIFAWCIAGSEIVTVLSPPPPERFHPSGVSNYQAIEEPIIQGQLGQNSVRQIIMIHPMVEGSEEFLYELWPMDKSFKWIEKFGLPKTRRKWREIRYSEDKLRLKELASQSDQHVAIVEYAERSSKNKVRPETYFWFVKLILTVSYRPLRSNSLKLSAYCLLFSSP